MCVCGFGGKLHPSPSFFLIGGSQVLLQNWSSFWEGYHCRIKFKKYVEGCARYDKDLHDVLEYLKQHKRLPNTIKSKKIKNDLETNISKTNDKRKQVNAEFHKWYHVGQKIISNKNTKTKGL